jgi:hypothetical protein
MVWQNFLKKYKLPTISEIQVTNARLGIPGLTLVFLLPVIFIFYKKGKNVTTWDRKSMRIFVPCLAIAILSFPLQVHVELPFMKQSTFSKPEASALVDQLLKNTYRAFNFREESDIYDKLAVSNDGELLSTIYLQMRKSMVIENQGGAKAKVKEINVLDVREEEADEEGLTYACKWTVKGTVGHWGHLHNRVNQYHALLNIRSVDGIWKLYGLDMIEEVRL